ncbi:protoporphyrinogen oxidase HemJ [Acuticoccus kandeliae]|uniref:protoporphyrinogen oxidase HemJ n=1 Tax=Acuticoccus kandeliae TaxID=2073160 RepID=UPI00196ABF37|nr:protoporphyrinogen oxidase HemJ [Acuticoccus kandeliae]
MMLFLWLKALHIIAIIAWMAALLYLPRLMVYHVAAETGSVQSETFKTMERRLLRAIANPAMIAAWILGIALATVSQSWSMPWLHAKLAFVLALTMAHMLMARWVREFRNDANTRSARFYRIANEVPTVLMIVIVIIVVVKPF